MLALSVGVGAGKGIGDGKGGGSGEGDGGWRGVCRGVGVVSSQPPLFHPFLPVFTIICRVFSLKSTVILMVSIMN